MAARVIVNVKQPYEQSNERGVLTPSRIRALQAALYCTAFAQIAGYKFQELMNLQPMQRP